MTFEIATFIFFFLCSASTQMPSTPQCSTNFEYNAGFDMLTIHCEHGLPEFSAYNETTLNIIQTLTVNHCPFASITRQSFENLGNLTTLKIDCAEIKVQNGALDNLTQLSELSIKNNSVAFSQHFFCNLKSLRWLTVSDNMISSDEALGLGSADSGQSLYCGQSIETLNAADNRLTSIGKDGFLYHLRALTELHLERNAIGTIDKEAFARVPGLSKLFLDGNEIEELEGDTFKYATNLTELNLSGNQLSDFQLNVFRPLTELISLNLSENLLTNLSNELFDSLIKLRELDLSNNRIGKVNGAFRNLRLKDLILSGNRLETIDREIIDGLRAFFGTILNLSHNAIRTVSVDPFSKLFGLWELDLSHNRLKEFPKFRTRTFVRELRMDHNEIEELNAFACNFTKGIGFLYLSYNQLTSIGPKAFAPFREINELYLSNNNIETVHDSAFDGLSDLEKLDLSGNKISFQNNAFDLNEMTLFTGLVDLFYLDLSNNQISEIFQSQFSLDKLEVLNLQNNSLTTIPLLQINMFATILLRGNPLLCDCALSWLNSLRTGMSSVFEPRTMTCKVLFDPEAKGIESKAFLQDLRDSFLCANFENRTDQSTVSSSNCSSWVCTQRQLCPDNCICYHNVNYTIVKMLCSNSSTMNEIPKKIPVSTDVTIFYNLSINSINFDTFESYSNVTHLAIRNTRLKYIHEYSFKFLKIVEIIDLSNNELAKIDHPIFKCLLKLRQIDISSNKLISIGLTVFDDLKSLESLNIANNFLTNFPVWSINSLVTVSLLAIGGNPWSCNCTFLVPLNEFLNSRSPLIADVFKLYCKHEPLSDEVVQFHAFRATHCIHTNFVSNDNSAKNRENVNIKKDFDVGYFLLSLVWKFLYSFL